MLDLDFDDNVETVSEKTPGYIIHDVEQNSDEWFAVRLGKITASDMQVLMSDKNGSNKQKLLIAKAAENIAGVYDDRRKVDTYDMQIGKKLEPEARIEYEIKHSVKVDQVGFVELNPFVGCSPDGFVGSEGMLEIKCPNMHNYLYQVISGKESVKSLYYTQMQMQLWICERQWCDYAIYNPNFDYCIHVMRFERNDQYIKQIEDKVEEAKQQIAEYIKQFNNVIGE